MKYISDVELMARFENEFGPVKADLLENIKHVVDETPGVEPEAFDSTCKKIAAVVPDLTNKIVAALPDIISNFDLCGSCKWFKKCHEHDETNNSSVKWIPIKYKKVNATEYQSMMLDVEIGEEIEIYNNVMPGDGEAVLITTSWGDVEIDVCCFDGRSTMFENHDDPDEVIAWAQLPEPYKKHS